MPLSLFGNKFSPKKTPPRRAQSLSNLHLDATESKAEFGIDYGALKVSLGGNEVAFENGLWINESGAGSGHKQVSQLRKQNETLHEENNLLKLKIDILLDMLAEKSAVSQFHENEVKQLRESKRDAKKR
uniref:Protein chibby homolog 1 n=1 Tax=Arion vulgaris TaxID=1028688 RepID=A0A0B6ZNN5_9EUPU